VRLGSRSGLRSRRAMIHGCPFDGQPLSSDIIPTTMKSQPFERPRWDVYFMGIAHAVAKRGNCCRRQVAAVAVRDHRIVSTGYNGTPRGIRNCYAGGCERCRSKAPSGSGLSECVCCHAEENAITHAAYHGIALRDATLYCTMSPCLTCAKMIINAGIKEVVYETEYSFSRQTRALLGTAGVRCRRLRGKGTR
jgi:dCMP deaminase